MPALRSLSACPALLLLVTLVSTACGQTVTPASRLATMPADSVRHDSAAVVAGPEYAAGGLHRTLLGDSYRDLWTKPLRVPVLDLDTFAGGLQPLEEGGGKQTRSLRLVTPSGSEYVFRSVDKKNTTLPPAYKGTLVQSIAQDQVSAHFPVAGLVTAPLLAAAGVLHPTPELVVMPDSPELKEFRATFAGQLGLIEEYPVVPAGGRGFAGAVEIIGSDSLLSLLNRDPAQHIDAQALLAARLMDMMFNDWDRHQGQWKWARMQPGTASAWLPIPRDRDKAFISYGGLMPSVARVSSANLMAYDSAYPAVRGLTWNSTDFDRRLLAGLSRPEWDSVAASLVRRLPDSIIAAAVQALPPEYVAVESTLALTLRQRRDGIPEAAQRFYLYLAAVVDIHATDAGEKLLVTRVDERFVDVQLTSATGEVSYHRTFDRTETREIRIYLHGGDDSALMTGVVPSGIPIWIVGGNGTNHLVDSSLVAGSPGARLYDAGHVSGISYGPVDTMFERRPWIAPPRPPVAPGPDYGRSLKPDVSFAYGDLDFLFGVGVTMSRYGFRKRPYASRLGLSAEFSTLVDAFRVGMAGDLRQESSPLHFAVLARVSRLQVVNYYGEGNTSGGGADAFFAAQQRQWLLQPAVAYDLGASGELSLGPVVQYSTTDSVPGTFIAETQPYGVGDFGQAGLQIRARYDTRRRNGSFGSGVLLELGGRMFPAIWSVTSAFGDVAAAATALIRIPVATKPTVMLRGGGRKVFGVYPWNESAFIGGAATVRTLVLQRYAGDASLYGSAELRVPLVNFPLVVPLNVGMFGFVDAGRVYLEGASPGGWHTAVGAGVWVGVIDPSTAVSIAYTSTAGETAVLVRAGLAF